MLRRVRADSIAFSFSPPRSRVSPVNSPSLPTDHWVEVTWLCTASLFLIGKLLIAAGAAAATSGALGGPCRFFGTGMSWSCTPLYVIMTAFVLSTAVSMCFRTGHPAEVHL
ncbi:hypothetical protein OIU78_024066 [Salix suchowensis]|nr:hypothetical protein OIU78_024066 [Salix suchowensis]